MRKIRPKSDKSRRFQNRFEIILNIILIIKKIDTLN